MDALGDCDSVTRAWVMLASSGSMLLVLVTAGAYRVVREGLHTSIKPFLRRLARVMCVRFKSPTDEIEAEVLKKVEAQKVDHTRLFCQFFALVMLPFTLELFIASCTGRPRVFTFMQDATTLVAQGTFGLALICPWAVTSRSVDAFYGMLGLAAVLGLLPPFTNPESMRSWTSVTGFSMMLLSMARRDFLSVFVFQFFFGLSTCSAIWVHEADELTEPLRAALFQFTVTVVGTALPCFLDMACYEIVSQGVVISSTRQVLEAAVAILHSYCDAIVELDEEGVIVGSAHMLGALLLRGDGGSLLGRRFAELISEEAEQQSFSEMLGTPLREGQGLASTINVTMKDTIRTTLRLQLMWFPFFAASGAKHYMLGVRDIQTADEGRDHVQEVEEAPDAELMLPSPRQQDLQAILARTPVSSIDDDAATLVSDFSRASDPLHAILVLGSSEAEGFRVEQVSPGFLSSVGRLSCGARLLDYVADEGTFANWLSMAACDMVIRLSDGRPIPEERKYTKASLIMPHGLVSVQCRLLKLHYPDADEALYDATSFDRMEVHFSDVHFVRTSNEHHLAGELSETVRL